MVDENETLESLEQRQTDDEPQNQLFYGSVLEFVEQMVLPVLKDRRIDPRQGARWSRRWWESPEALLRLDAMWRAFEHLRQDPATGISVWMKDHFDVHMSTLMSPVGPFGKSRDQSDFGEPAPHDPPPKGTFPDQRTPPAERN